MLWMPGQSRSLLPRLAAIVISAGVAALASAQTVPGGPTPPGVSVEGDVSSYIYGGADGWSLPSQTARRLAQKKEELSQLQEAKSRAQAAKLAADISQATADPIRQSLPELPPSPRTDDSIWRLTQLALATLVGITIAVAWNHFRQRRWAAAGNGPAIISVFGAQGATVVTGPAAAPAPRVPPRGRARRTRYVAPRRIRIMPQRRDPHNESIRSLASWGILPKWVRDMTPLLSDGARLAGAVTDDVQMFQSGGDAIPNYAYMIDPKGMAAFAERQKEATAMVWSHQQWQRA